MDKVEALFTAIEDGENEVTKKLLEDDPTLANATNSRGQTAFWWAASFGRTPIIKQMLEEPIRGILDYRKSDNLLRNALHAAKAYNNREIIEMLNPVFGVGVYTAYEEEEEDAPSRHSSFIHRITGNIANLGFRPSSMAISAAAILIVAFTALMVIWQQPEPSIHDMLASGGEDTLEKAVQRALSQSEPGYERQQQLIKKLRGLGWTLISISREQSVQYNSSDFDTNIVCRIHLQGSGQSIIRTIEVKGASSPSPLILSNLYELPSDIKELRNQIIEVMIQTCIPIH